MQTTLICIEMENRPMQDFVPAEISSAFAKTERRSLNQFRKRTKTPGAPRHSLRNVAQRLAVLSSREKEHSL